MSAKEKLRTEIETLRAILKDERSALQTCLLENGALAKAIHSLEVRCDDASGILSQLALAQGDVTRWCQLRGRVNLSPYRRWPIEYTVGVDPASSGADRTVIGEAEAPAEAARDKAGAA